MKTQYLIPFFSLFFILQGCSDNASSRVAYKASAVATGKICSTIRSTGTVEPEDLIDVGSQITGQILAFGLDTAGKEIDYCSRVKQGQLLAEIDSVTYAAELTIAQASLATAKADLLRMEANLNALKAQLDKAERDWTRVKKIGVGDAMSQAAFDTYQSDFEVANANFEIGKTQILQGKASIEKANADVAKANRNFSYCRILSPVDGVIIDRRVNIGQTVVSSMSTSSLFLIAKDLSKIQIWVPVNEADIGQIKPGMKVTFTIDAFADATFTGTVEKIRLNASMTSNVVTYTVEIATENPDEKILPYLTANVRFILQESSDNALLVPLAALRWKPENAQNVDYSRIFVLRNGEPNEIRIERGVSDDSMCEIRGNDIAEGDFVITGIYSKEETEKVKAAGGNPFLPQMPKGQKRMAPPPM